VRPEELGKFKISPHRVSNLRAYHSNDGAVLLHVCVVVGMLLHSNEHLQISTVADRLSMFATCGRIPWKVPTVIANCRTPLNGLVGIGYSEAACVRRFRR
jgi:hypothetical protein